MVDLVFREYTFLRGRYSFASQMASSAGAEPGEAFPPVEPGSLHASMPATWGEDDVKRLAAALSAVSPLPRGP